MASSTIVLIILLCALILFLIPRIPLLFTCLAVAVALYFTGVATPAEALGGFSSVATWSIIGMSMMTGAFFSTGLADVVGAKLFSFTKGSQKSVIVAIYVIAAFFSTFTSSLAVVLMLGPMVDAMVAKSNGTLTRKMLWMPMAIGALLGGNTSMMGATNMLATSGMLEAATGKALHFFAPAPIALPGIIVGLIYYMTIGPKTMEKVFDFPDVPAVLGDGTAEFKDGKLSWKAKLAAVIMAITIVLLIWNKWNMGLVTFAASALLIVTGCCSAKQAIDAVKWDVVLEMAAMIGFAGVISSSGAGEVIGSTLLSVAERFDIGEFGVCVAVMLMCHLLSNFMSNNAGVVITVPIALSVAQLIGGNAYAFAVVAVVSVNSAFVTPMACPLMNVTLTAGYRFSDYFRANALLNLLIFLSSAVACYLYYYI